MEHTKQRVQDKDIEKIMGNLLRYGVILSAIIVIIGAVIYLFQHGNALPNYKEFAGEPKGITEVKKVWKTAFDGRGRSIIQLGLLVLIATPIARIIFSIIGYIFEKDYLYIIITIIVLSVILFSLW
jgi:uncharacterized membrane protein